MVKRLMWALVGAIAIFSAPVRAEKSMPQVQSPPTESIDISARPVHANRLSECRLSGRVILWASRPVEVLDDTQERLGAIEAGLAQFSSKSKLEKCVPDGGALDLSGQFANFLIADDRSLKSGRFGRREASAFASQLAQDFYHLADREGTLIPLVDGIKTSAIGSVSYRFKIVLIRGAKSGSIDAIINRETLGTKFAPHLSEADRHLSRLKWSSLE
jgi:hypothetical protein